MNRVTLLGRLGKDPEIRSTQSGEKVASFSVATSEQWKDKAQIALNHQVHLNPAGIPRQPGDKQLVVMRCEDCHQLDSQRRYMQPIAFDKHCANCHADQLNFSAVELAEHQRADAERIARPDQLLVGQADEGIGAFQRPQTLDETVDEARLLGARDQMQHHLGIGGRLHDGALVDELLAKREPVGEVAVMADGEAERIEFGE